MNKYSTKKNNPFRILVADIAGYDSTAEIPYLVSGPGREVDVYCGEQSWLCSGSFVKKHIIADTVDSEAYAEGLMELARSGQYNWIILADDTVIRIMNDKVVDETLFKKLLPLSNIWNRGMLGSKAGLSLLCTKYGIQTPEYRIYGKDGKGLDDLEFPLLLKKDKSEAGAGVMYCQSKKDFDAQITQLTASDKENLVIQRYIQGDNVAVEALYREGALLGYSVSRVLQTFPNEFGTSILRVYGEEHDLKESLIEIGRVFGASGFANMTFMKERATGRYFLIEMDMRPQVWFVLGTQAGTNFAPAIAAYIEGDCSLVSEPKIGQPKIIRHFSRDILDSMQRKDFKNLFHWALNKGWRWKSIPLYDPVLSYEMFRRGIRLFAKTVLSANR